MRTLWNRLETLRAIVDTAQAGDLERQPEAVRTRYEPYAEAYFVLEAVRRLEQRLIGELRLGRSVTGYLSADFGYGKTATAVYLWKQCMDGGVVAIPPFMFRQLKDMMQAIRGWLAYQLEHTQAPLVAELEQAYLAHVERSVDDLAREIVGKQGISEAKARAIVQEHIAQRRDVTTTQSVLDFMRDATELAQQAGFKGLVVFADEMQEFLRTEDRARDAIQTLSELVKGVRAIANVPLGLMLTMPVQPTEAVIEEQAGDVIQRMRERGTGLQLQDAYGRDFPRDLWGHLCASFGDDSARLAVDERTLEALGQLCERKDLSNGPRTVINSFKRIALQHQQSHRAYSPIDLVEDYLQGHVVFEGREAKLTGTLRRLLELPAVKRDSSCRRAVMLLAAFPRGVDEAKGDDLYSVIEDLAEKDRLLGEHIIQLAEGYGLVGLQERAEARPLLDEIVRDFRRRWHHQWNDTRKAQLAAAAFFQDLLPLAFPQRGTGQYANFGGHKNHDRDLRGVAYLLLEGCFERLCSRFPDRKVCVSVSTDPNDLNRFQPTDERIDLDFRFHLELPEDSQADATPTRIISANQDRRVDVHVNMRRTFGRQFPPDLAFLSNIMSPERTSAQVLLGLSQRMWGWLQEHPDTSDADRQLIEAQRRALHRLALHLLLPDASDTVKLRAQGIKVSGAEQRLIESAFEAKCTELYPQYRPLMVTKEWRNQLRRYRDALAKRPLAERRGRQPFAGSKDDIASAFGWSHTVFEASSRTLQSMGVLEVRWGSGRGAESEATVLFREHPLEMLLREALQRQGRTRTVATGGQVKHLKALEVSRLREAAGRQGYLADEVDEALELLILRQYMERRPDGTIQEFAGSLDADELTHQARQLDGCLSQLAIPFRNELSNHERLLRDARDHLASPADEVALDAAQRALHEVRVRLDEFVKGKARQLADQLATMATEVERRRHELQPRELEQQVTGAVTFERHVDDQRTALRRQFSTVDREWGTLREKAVQTQREAQAVADEKALCAIVTSYGQLDTEKQHLESKLRALQPYLVALSHWREVVAKATGLRDRLEADSPLRHRLDDSVTTAVMEDFAHRGLEALLDWERFKADVDTIEAEMVTEESRRRDDFLRCKEEYERTLALLTPQRMLQATFDPKDADQSYQVLYQAALRRLQDWLSEQNDTAQRALNELDYLIRERDIRVADEYNLADQVVRELSRGLAILNQDVVGNFARFQAYCDELRGMQARLVGVVEQVSKKRTLTIPPTDEESPLLEALTSKRLSLEDLRRQSSHGATLDNLFELLKKLYRKGHIEIEVRRRA